jgi:hypothetical protein
MGADLARARAGQKTKTGMSAAKLEDFAMKPKSHMPSGAGQSPKGDIGEMRQKEAGTMKGFKDAGPVKKTAGKFGSLTVNAAKNAPIG